VGVVIGRPGIGLGTGVGAIGGVGLGDGANLGGNTQQQKSGNPTAGVWQYPPLVMHCADGIWRWYTSTWAWIESKRHI